MIISNKLLKNTKIPQPTLSRLCKIYSLLEEFRQKGETTISSQEIGKRLGEGSHSIRKDVGYLNESGTSGSGYKINRLQKRIQEAFGFNNQRNACIIGLGSLGSILINGHAPTLPCFSIIAGFDSNTNILETVQTSIPLYPTYEIPQVLKKENIEMAIITEPDRNMETIMDRLIEGGIRGIINMTPMIISSSDKSIYIRNLDIFTEFRFLSALFTLNPKEL
ncbi:MAG: redox-sensing transcriptional repressor Rex [Spirochaetes bacterium]|nr:redox-sensing transcriptional repressor Rex [Spirochaetota bacterium]